MKPDVKVCAVALLSIAIDKSIVKDTISLSNLPESINESWERTLLAKDPKTSLKTRSGSEKILNNSIMIDHLSYYAEINQTGLHPTILD